MMAMLVLTVAGLRLVVSRAAPVSTSVVLDVRKIPWSVGLKV